MHQRKNNDKQPCFFLIGKYGSWCMTSALKALQLGKKKNYQFHGSVFRPLESIFMYSLGLNPTHLLGHLFISVACHWTHDILSLGWHK